MGSMNAIPQTFEFWQDRRMPYVRNRGHVLAEHVISLIAIQHFQLVL